MSRAVSLRHPPPASSRRLRDLVGWCAIVFTVPIVASAQSVSPWTAAAPLPAIREEDLRVGGLEERYLKALSVRLANRERSWLLRGEYRRAATAVGLDGPWRIDSTQRRLAFRGGRIHLGLNTGFPLAREDGPAWAGRGITVAASPTLAGRWGVFSYRMAPELWWTANTDFALIPAGPTPFSDPAKGGSIDLPQRFGPDPLGRIDPGESHLAAEWRGVRVAVTAGALRIGAGSEQAMLLQGGQGGFPRFEVGSPDGLATPLGRLTGTLGWGRLAQTPWAAHRRVGARLGGYLVAGWTPPGDRIDLGVARFYHRDWAGIRARDLLVPFGSLFRDDQTLGLDAVDNQLAVLFARVRAPGAGLELFGEFGRNDRSKDGRDLFVELEHNSAWLIGAQRVWRIEGGALRSLTLSGASGRIPAVTRYRGQASFYEHSPLAQGHTMRGQALGTTLMERDGGIEMRFDRFATGGVTAIVLTSRAMANQRAEAVTPEARRHEWGVWWERHQGVAHGRWHVRVGGIADLGRGPTGRDAFGVHVGGGLTWQR